MVILWKNKKDNFWTIIALLASALAITMIATYFLKHYFERPRPLNVFGDENVNTLVEKAYRYSFPSGHTSIAFAVCASMFMIVRKYWYIIFALFLGFYRIYAGSHFLSDVLCGALIGTISAYLTVNLFRRYSKI